MSKYRELLEQAKSVTGEGDCIILALTTALRELEAFNDEHQSLHSLMQMQIEKLEARVAGLEKALHQVRVLTDVNCDEAFSIVCAALSGKEGE